MSEQMARNSKPDFRGARGSNTGDDFHELWAMRQALRLLEQSSELTAIALEGMTAELDNGSEWDGVDCLLLYGGTTASTAAKVEIQQLKYSSANPNMAWTIGRLTAAPSKKAGASVIGRLAAAYIRLRKERGSTDGTSIAIKLVSNQPISSELEKALADAKQLFRNGKVIIPASNADLRKLRTATGLTAVDFVQFVERLNLSGSTGSRFSIEGEVLKQLANWDNVEFIAIADSVRRYLHDLTLPERAGAIVTREDILIKLGAGDHKNLFPAPTAIAKIPHLVHRDSISELVSELVAGQKYICLHGAGGLGKTTALQQIQESLPSGSVFVLFDCYGGGSYLNAGHQRHRPQDAFVQLTNDLAEKFLLPTFLVPKPYSDYPRIFWNRLKDAAGLLAATQPEAYLVVALDAVDNALTAASQKQPPDVCFIRDFLTFDDLPENVRFIVSCRTSRLDTVQLPGRYHQVELRPFEASETAELVRRFWQAPDTWLSDFQTLSRGVPRVQSYALKSSEPIYERAIDALLPNGKGLEQVFAEQLGLAFRKHGGEELVRRFCAAVTDMPRPVPIDALASVLGVEQTAIADILSDLTPGFLATDGFVNFADEDFEAYTRQQGTTKLSIVRESAANHFLSIATSNSYAALAVAPALSAAGKYADLLNFVEREPEPPPGLMPDAAQRREIGSSRLRLAIQVAKQAGATSRALRFVLLGAEAIRSEDNLRAFLVEQRRLSVRFAEDVVNRLILRDSSHIEEHGPILAHMIGNLAGTKHNSSVLQIQRRLQSWLKVRWDDYEKRKAKSSYARAWEIDEEDFGAILYATAVTSGGRAAVDKHLAQSWQFAMPAGLMAVEQLLAEGRANLVKDIAEALPSHRAAFVWVLLAISGAHVDLAKLEASLRALRRLISPTADMVKQYGPNEKYGPIAVDTLLSGLELLILRGCTPADLSDWLAPFLDKEVRRIESRSASESHLLDAIMRSYFLSEAVSGHEGNPESLLIGRPKLEGKQARQAYKDTSEHDREINEVIGSVAKFYAWRAKFIAAGHRADGSSVMIEEGLEHLAKNDWSIRRRWESFGMRAKAAESLAVLAGDSRVSQLIVKTAVGVRNGWSPYSSSSADKLFLRLRNVQSLHAKLLEMVITEAAERRRDRIGAKDKSNAIAKLADWIVFISPEDARALFQTAISVAQELDDEIVDQITLLGALIFRWREQRSNDDVKLACRFADVIEDAGVRLSDLDHFPWREALQALAQLHFGTALGCAARWHDTDVAVLNQTLDAVIVTGLKQRTLATGQAVSLTQLLDNAPDDLVAELVAAAKGIKTDCGALAEFFARNELLDRTGITTQARVFAQEEGAGPWTEALKKSLKFEEELAAREPNAGRQQEANSRTHDVAYIEWSAEEVLDPARLRSKIAVIMAEARGHERYISTREVLQQARQSVRVGDRTRHLDALLALQDPNNDAEALEALMAALGEWSAQPAVSVWSRTRLPDLIASNLPFFSRYLPRDDGLLDRALTNADVSPEQAVSILLDGIGRNVVSLSGRAILALVGRMATSITSNEAADLTKWYIDRLANRLPIEVQKADSNDVATTSIEALGRFFFAVLGDVDLYLRWRSAHALRVLAEFNDKDTICAIWGQWDRRNDQSYRQADAPYYWLASRLWLVIATDRIAVDRPNLLAPIAGQLFEVATDEKLPHLLIRAYAADAIRKLKLTGDVQLTAAQEKKLEEVNVSALPYEEKLERNHRSFDFYDPKKEANVRFHFNGLDTLRYWYSSWLTIFANVSKAEFVQTADHFISNEWGVVDEPPYGSKERRNGRFTERNWQRSNNGHGSLPTLERYQQHLEWHAMWCAAGELLKVQSLAMPEHPEDYGTLEYEIAIDRLTCPPIWLSDILGARPLTDSLWRTPSKPVKKWCNELSDEEAYDAILPADKSGYVVVAQSSTTRSSKFRNRVSLSTGLVSPSRAMALVRALQTTRDQFDYHIPPEHHEHEIQHGEFRLRGWLRRDQGDSRFDRLDRFSNGVRRIEASPGTAVTQFLGLSYRFAHGVKWFRSGAAKASMIYEAWGHPEVESERDEYVGEQVVSNGYRLLMAADDLAAFLTEQGMDLIVEAGFQRDEKGNRAASYGEEGSTEVELERVLVLAADGSIRAAERDFGTWR